MTRPLTCLKAFKLKCPYCGDSEATIRLDLNDLRTCICSGCEEPIFPPTAVDLISDQLARWQALVKWIESTAELGLE